MTKKTADRVAALTLAAICEEDDAEAKRLADASAKAFVALVQERSRLRAAGIDPDSPESDGTLH